MLAALDDDELMIRVQSGDTDAFEELVDRHQQSLIGFFVHNTRDVQLSEDLSQETLLKVFNQSWDYLPQGRFRGWLFRMARNLLIDDVRRRSHDALIRAVSGRQPHDEEGDPLARAAAEFIPPDLGLQRSELTLLVQELLDEIPEDQRMTFVLHHYAELPLTEVADIMDTNLATAKSRLRLAREKLAEKLRLRGYQPAAASSS